MTDEEKRDLRKQRRSALCTAIELSIQLDEVDGFLQELIDSWDFLIRDADLSPENKLTHERLTQQLHQLIWPLEDSDD
jgi:hypothetical protein